MEIEQTAKIMHMLKEHYPNSFENTSIENRIKAWHLFLKDYDYDVMAGAVMSYISSDTKGFMPVVGQLIDKVHKMKAPKSQIEDQDAWKMVRRALRNNPEQAREQYEKLPPILQRTLGSSNTLRDWAMVDDETLNSVVQSNFLRIYRAKVQNQSEYEKLPQSVKQLSAQIFKSLPDGGDQE